MDNLLLRNFREADFEAFHALVSDYDVVKMLAMWPFPSDPEFTLSRMNTPQAKAGLFRVIECGGLLVGTIGVVNGHLGYMIARDFWGQGIATWALRESVAAAFMCNDFDGITAGVWDDNPASMAVLGKCGFVEVGKETAFCKGRGCDATGTNFALSRADWAKTQPLHIETDRLIIRPFEVGDEGEFANLMRDKEISRMMGSISNSFTKEQALVWITERAFTGKLGFAAKMTLKNGAIIGHVRIGAGRLRINGDEVSAGYAIGRAFRGQGYITEGMQAFIKNCTATYALKEITAGAMSDNPASLRVLEKLSFVKTGERMHLVKGRLEEAPLFLYRLDTSKFRTKQ